MRGSWCVCGGWLFAGLLLPGCMASGVQFAGSRQAPVTTVDGVTVGGRAPEGTRRLGRASVECKPLAPDHDLSGARASDLSCSRPFLRSALREGAAEAGGSFLQEPDCEEKHSGARVSWIGCDADVWSAAEAQPLSSVPASPFGTLRDAWRISIDFWPAAGHARPAPRDVEGVVEVDFPRAGQVRLGDLSARCSAGCAQDSLRRGLRAAAAWLGAEQLAAVRCIQQDDVTSCTASVSAPEHDEAAGVTAAQTARD